MRMEVNGEIVLAEVPAYRYSSLHKGLQAVSPNYYRPMVMTHLCPDGCMLQEIRLNTFRIII